jgi:hypothetical protein
MKAKRMAFFNKKNLTETTSEKKFKSLKEMAGSASYSNHGYWQQTNTNTTYPNTAPQTPGTTPTWANPQYPNNPNPNTFTGGSWHHTAPVGPVDAILAMLENLTNEDLTQIQEKLEQVRTNLIDTICPNCEGQEEIPEDDYICRKCRGL